MLEANNELKWKKRGKYFDSVHIVSHSTSEMDALSRAHMVRNNTLVLFACNSQFTLGGTVANVPDENWIYLVKQTGHLLLL